MATKSLILLIFLLQAVINGVSPNDQNFICSKNGNFDSDKPLKDRDDAFNLLYRTLNNPSKPPYPGYDSKSSDGVWVVALCPPNVKMEDYQSCVNKTIPYLKKNCPKQKEGVAWTIYLKLYCMVSYANHPNLPNIVEWAWFRPPATQPPTPANAGELEKGLNDLSNKLKEMAKGLNNHKYGYGSISYGSGSHTLYASMQCTPGIATEECGKCLSDATNEIHKCCSKLRKTRGIVLSTKCNFWYDHFKFFP